MSLDLLNTDERRPTAHQQGALDNLVDWWKLPRQDKERQHCILSAAAGCGKTFLAKYFAAAIKDAHPLFTATTNEAARQLSLAGVNVFGTTHSALGLSQRKTSEKIMFLQGNLPEEIYEHNLLVVDEASMAGKADFTKEDAYPLIVDYADDLGMRTLWLGDGYQLPPVESDDAISPIFQQGWRTVTLSEVMRNSGNVLAYCTKLRAEIDKKSRSFPRAPKCDEIATISPGTLYRALRGADMLDELRRGDTRILVWRNNNADRLNEFIRIGLHGDSMARENSLLPTDQVLFTAPAFGLDLPQDADDLINWDMHIKASVNTRAEVISVMKSELYGLETYKCKFRLEEGGEILGHVLTTEGKAKFAKLKVAFTASLEKMSAGKKQSSWVWWHTFDSCFVKLKHSYAITTHRSQGSNIKNVIVDAKDILSASWKQPLLAYKMVYTACSRTKQHLTLVKEN